MNLYNLNFHKSIENEEFPQAIRIAMYIKEFIKPKNFIDFGSSSGIYVDQIQKNISTFDAI